MNVLVIAAIALLWVEACAPAAHQRAVTIVSIFGPVIGRDTIAGRADDKTTFWLMTGTSLVRVDLGTRQRNEVRLETRGGEPHWGLARLTDGSLWTLNGQNTLTRIDADGKIAQEFSALGAYLGVHGSGDRLVLQPANLSAGGPAIVALRPEDGKPRPWSGMTVRAFERLAPGAAAALNLVSCGASQGAEMPCWFPGDAALSLIAADGATRRIVLDAVTPIAPELLLKAGAPPRPVRDVFVERDGTIWVLASGAPKQATNLPGGWMLARYGSKGQLIDQRTLPEPVRLLLRAGSGRAVVLTGAGMVAEVQP